MQAKVALLLGAEQGMRYLNRRPGAEGLAIRRDGTLLRSAHVAGYRRYVRVVMVVRHQPGNRRRSDGGQV